MKRGIKILLFTVSLLATSACTNEPKKIDEKVIDKYDTNNAELNNSDDKPFYLEDCFCDENKMVVNESGIEGYTDKESYFPGEEIEVFVHSKAEKYNAYFIHSTQEGEMVKKFTNQKGKEQNYSECAYKNGYDWEKSFSFKLPENLKSGYYMISLENRIDEFHIPLIIKSNNPKNSDILILASYNTWQAYNEAGGASFYRYHLGYDCEFNNSMFISFKRPLYNIKGTLYEGGGFEAELAITHWLEREGIPFHVISDRDFHFNQYTPDEYKSLMINTHGEYWSKDMYDQIENYLGKGGSLMYLSGNGIYWKVTFDGDRMECQKEFAYHYQDSTKGGTWRSLNRNESRVLGVAYGYWGYGTFAPYIVVNPDHWIFDGTNVEKGDLIGKSLNRKWASGHETDRRTTVTPKNAVLLAEGLNKQRIHELGDDSKSKDGGAHLMYYDHEGGGGVYAAGSITFGGSLLADSVMSQMTLNVIEKFTK